VPRREKQPALGDGHREYGKEGDGTDHVDDLHDEGNLRDVLLKGIDGLLGGHPLDIKDAQEKTDRYRDYHPCDAVGQSHDEADYSGGDDRDQR